MSIILKWKLKELPACILLVGVVMCIQASEHEASFFNLSVVVQS